MSGYSKAYYASHKDELLAKARDKYARNRDAMRLRARAYYAKNREARRKYDAQNAERALAGRYGMTLAERTAMWEAQGRACYLCRRSIPRSGRDVHTDHDHRCCPTQSQSCRSCVRGLACGDCNRHIIPMIEKGHPLVAHLARQIVEPPLLAAPQES